MLVVAFGTYDVEAHPRVGVLIQGLRMSGIEVEELNKPLGLDTADRVRMLRQPWRAAKLLAMVGLRWYELWRSTRRLTRVPDAILVGYLAHFDVHLARRLFPASVIILDHLVSGAGTATDRGVSGPRTLGVLRTVDDAALRAADIIVVDTQEHREALGPQRRLKAVVVPVGAADAWFTAPTFDREDEDLRIVFFGLFTPLQGAPVIARALRLLDGEGLPYRATLVGRGQEWEACRDILAGVTRVTWIPWVHAADLPGVVAQHDVCLGIFGNGPKARRVVPTKVFQGAAAGRAIITSDTEPQRRALGSSAVFTPPGDAAALAAALAALARDRPLVRRMQKAARARADQRFAPSQTVEPLLDLIMRPARTTME